MMIVNIRLEGYIIKFNRITYDSVFFSFFQSITALIPGFFDDLVFSSDDSSIDEDDDTARSRLFSKFSIYSLSSNKFLIFFCIIL